MQFAILNGVEIFYLPPNTSKWLQPLDQHIFHLFKQKLQRNPALRFGCGVEFLMDSWTLSIAIIVQLPAFFHRLMIEMTIIEKDILW